MLEEIKHEKCVCVCEREREREEKLGRNRDRKTREYLHLGISSLNPLDCMFLISKKDIRQNLTNVWVGTENPKISVENRKVWLICSHEFCFPANITLNWLFFCTKCRLSEGSVLE